MMAMQKKGKPLNRRADSHKGVVTEWQQHVAAEAPSPGWEIVWVRSFHLHPPPPTHSSYCKWNISPYSILASL